MEETDVCCQERADFIDEALPLLQARDGEKVGVFVLIGKTDRTSVEAG